MKAIHKNIHEKKAKKLLKLTDIQELAVLIKGTTDSIDKTIDKIIKLPTLLEMLQVIQPASTKISCNKNSGVFVSLGDNRETSLDSIIKQHLQTTPDSYVASYKLLVDSYLRDNKMAFNDVELQLAYRKIDTEIKNQASEELTTQASASSIAEDDKGKMPVQMDKEADSASNYIDLEHLFALKIYEMDDESRYKEGGFDRNVTKTKTKYHQTKNPVPDKLKAMIYVAVEKCNKGNGYAGLKEAIRQVREEKGHKNNNANSPTLCDLIDVASDLKQECKAAAEQKVQPFRSSSNLFTR